MKNILNVVLQNHFSSNIDECIRVKYILENKFIPFLKENNTNILFKEIYNIEIMDLNSIIEKFSKLGELFFLDIDYLLILGKNYYITIFVTNFLNKTSLKILIKSSSFSINEKVNKEIVDLIKDKKFDSSCANIRWFYKNSRGNIEYEDVQETITDIIHPESYPYILDINKFIESYINSDEQVLIFVGPAGTGKTRFIKYIIKTLFKKYEKNINSKNTYDFEENDNIRINYTTDMEVLEQEKIFIDLLNKNTIGFVLEDIDESLKARKNGNMLMHKILNASDGIFANKTKIILSTNLEDINNIDSALLRDGRCFAVVNTRLLSNSEGQKLIRKLSLNKEYNLDKSEYTLAELYALYNKKETFLEKHNEIKKIGF